MNLTVRYFQLFREIKNDIRNVKSNYKIGIANHAKKYPKSFFEMYSRKVRDHLGSFMSNDETTLK